MQNIICSQSDLQPNTSKTQLYGIAHKQTIICRQLFAGHVVGSRPMKRKKNLLRIPTGKYDVHVRTLAMNLLGLSLKLIPICLLPFFFFFFFNFSMTTFLQFWVLLSGDSAEERAVHERYMMLAYVQWRQKTSYKYGNGQLLFKNQSYF